MNILFTYLIILQPWLSAHYMLTMCQASVLTNMTKIYLLFKSFSYFNIYFSRRYVLFKEDDDYLFNKGELQVFFLTSVIKIKGKNVYE